MRRILFMVLVLAGVWTGAVNVRVNFPVLAEMLKELAHPQAIAFTDALTESVTPAKQDVAAYGPALIGVAGWLVWGAVAVRRTRSKTYGDYEAKTLAASGRAVESMAKIADADATAEYEPLSPAERAIGRADAKNLRERLARDRDHVRTQLGLVPPLAAKAEADVRCGLELVAAAERELAAAKDVRDQACGHLAELTKTEDGLKAEYADILAALAEVDAQLA